MQAHALLPTFHPFSLLSVWLTAIFVLSLLFFESAFAQEGIRILSHEFDPDDITVGDAVQLRLLIEADENLHIYLDAIDLSNHQHLEVDKPQVKRIKPERPIIGKALYEVTYLLRAFAPGTHTLPPITIEYTDTNANNASLQTPAYSFEVRSVKPPDVTEMKDIKPPFPAPHSLLPYILATLLIIMVVGGLIFFYVRKRAKPIHPQPEVQPQRPSHEIAYEQLNRIEALNLITQGKMKVYHTEISQAIRQYIAVRYNIPALELTTEDLLVCLGHEDIQDEHLSLIQDFFANCDVVKFARYHPTKPEAHERMDEARRIVDATKELWEDKCAGQEDEEGET